MPALSSTTPVVASSDDAIEPLLSQLFASQFVLTDRDGAVTRWSTAAQALLGFGPEAMAGQPLLEALAVGVSAPPLGGRLDAKLRRQDGLDLDVELTFVPVSMKLSLEFNGFLETLSSTMGMKDASGLLRRSHGPVIDWIDSALVGQARLEEDELMAGVIVAFRPTGEPLPSLLPDVAQAPEPGQDGGYAPPESVDEFSQIGLAIQEAALAAEEAQASVASAHVETAATAARVAGLEEYSDGLQRQLERTSSLVEEMRAELTGARAADPTGELRAEVERLSGELAAAGELRGELTEAQEKLRGITAALEDGRQAALDAEALRRELDATSGAVNQLGEEVRASRDADRSEALQAELEETRGSLERLEAELADGRVRYETLARLESELADLRATSPALDGVQHELEGLQREVTELRAQALQAGDTQPADEARDLLAELRGELAVLSTRAEKSQGSAEARLRELEAQIRQAAAEAAQQADTARQAALDVQRDAARAEEGAGQAREATRSAQELSEQALERAESAATASAAAGARQTEELTARLDEARAAIDQATTAAAERVEGIASTNLALAAERSSAADSQVSGVGDAASAAQASALQAEQAVGASEQALAEMRALAERIETGLAATERAAGLAGEQAEQATAAAALARAASEEAALETTIARKQAVAAQGSAVEAGRYAVSSRAPGPMPTVNVARDKKLPMFGKPASAGPARKPKLGFDDAPLPMAAIGLDGRFLELNPPFAQLVGYGEQEFRAATWPPVVDRPNLPKHRDQMRSLLEGEIESARVDTAYLHAQGLLVPVKGQLTLARDDDGKPKLFMLQIHEGAAAGS